MPTLRLSPAESSDREYVETILEANDLPTADLDAAFPALFVCVGESERSDLESRETERRIGVAGLEVEGNVGLLRSVAVEQSARGRGFGTAICEQLLDRARAENLDTVYLLTTTAAEFFADLGFEAVERETVPKAIRDTAEFSDLCPTSATCMKKSLS
ncbi:arsenic resistance N-acetyltransferase ArsN2 [Halorussus halophilus]|uniref:arsenic resistance N-acetyltransferase ArsN2 n=1 Tax=Halorussus halophilus TaxID=2650975 RepID=UPI001CE484CC|nr:arsenic resistance N-acetyltransferase ArsN2 [Halorussus halophilus]